MFESVGELAVVSVLLGVTVFAFVYLAWRGAHDKRTKGDLRTDRDSDPSRGSPRSA